jgi:hypothetical protein
MNPNLKVTHGRTYIDGVVLTAFDLLYDVKFGKRLRVDPTTLIGITN